jgi:cell division protease FtsH
MMVCSFGMVEGIGPVRYGEFRNHPHSRIDAPMPDSLGNETAREIDVAIRELVKDALETARKVLKENADELEKFAQALLEKETMDISEINELLGRTAKNDSADNGIVIDPEDTEEVAENADGE